MLKEILAVSGKPGLYKLISKGNNLTIIESLTDKKRIPAYSHDKLMSVGDVYMYTTDGETSIHDILTTIQTKENNNPVSFDYAKAEANGLRDYFAEILPDFDRERVYPTDIKKLLKWYDLLIANGITDFSKEEEEEASVAENTETDQSTEEGKEAPKTATSVNPQITKPTSTKRKESALVPAKSAKAMPMAKNATPKKSIVGSKRGS